MEYAGIDLGSRFIKIAVEINGHTELIRENTIDFYKKRISGSDKNLSIDLSFLGIDSQNTQVLATGYGRNLLSFENVTVISEIKAHFYGAKHQSGENSFILTDIGGQDCKVIDVKEGYINDFTMNDKCAASTGRFIEQSSTVLDIPMEEFISLTENPATLPDTCAVFCESELIGQLARGVTAARLAAGVNLSVAKRLAPQIKKYGQRLVLAAGGAASDAIMYFLSDLTGAEIKPLANKQFNAAIGCVTYMKRLEV